MNKLTEELKKIKSKIDLQARIEYENNWCRLTGYKIGDKVSAYFHTSYLGTQRRKTVSYGSSSYKPAIIKVNDNGTLDVISVDALPQAYSVSNGRTGRDYKSHWTIREEFKTVKIDCIDISHLENEA